MSSWDLHHLLCVHRWWRHGQVKNFAAQVFSALLFSAVASPLFAADTYNDATLLKQASQTMGYYVGQTESLKLVIEHHPSLEHQASIAQGRFDAEFGVAISRIDSLLIEKMPSLWIDSRSELTTRIRQATDDRHSVEKARLFIQEVLERANGNMDSPFLETLLNFKYHRSQHPELEFLDGYTLRYRNDGSDKAKGMAFSMKYPQSWSSLEASRPNIPRKFISEKGAGRQTFMVLVKDFEIEPGTEDITEEDVSDFIADGGIQEMLPDNVLFQNGGQLTVEGLPGFWSIYSLESSRLRTSFQIEVIAYTIFMGTTTIQLQGQVVTHINGDALDNGGLPRFQNLFDQMANSLVIESLY